MRKIGAADLDDIAVGAALLGAGGGGDPYIGSLMARHAIEQHGPIDLLPLDDVPDDWHIITCGGMGAPTVLLEKIPSGEEQLAALRYYERITGRKVDALISIEAGGVNSCIPIMLAAQAGLPLIDADGMGRAFPKLEMITYNVYGVAASPVIVTDEKLDICLVQSESAAAAEYMARGITIRMGGSTYTVSYPMDGTTVKRVAVPGTLSLTQEIGRVVRAARAERRDVVDALIELFAGTSYGHAERLGAGKISDLTRKEENGWSIGKLTVTPFDSTAELQVRFQNENLVVERDGMPITVVPDLICIIETDSGQAITTERLRYGQRVTLLGIRVPPVMRTDAALAVFGPQAFGLEMVYRPLGL